jgi:hypothetical protein
LREPPEAVDQSLLGLIFDVQSKVAYELIAPGVTKTYPITVTGSAGPSDALIGVQRLGITNERLISEDIEAFIKELE